MEKIKYVFLIKNKAFAKFVSTRFGNEMGLNLDEFKQKLEV